VPEGIARDVAITWAGAAGCLSYLWALYRHGRQGTATQRFLLVGLAALLFLRGFDWLSGEAILGRLTFAVATWLPLALTLFTERVLRQHAPLWVKILALSTTVVFFSASMLVSESRYRLWLVGFAVCFVALVLLDGVLLLVRDRSGLSEGENRLADTLVLLAFVSMPLVVSDFRTTLGLPAVRLGAVAALLFTYSMSGSAVRSTTAVVSAGRWALLLASAAVLSALLALASHTESLDAWRSAALSSWPLACAWMLLTGIVVNVHGLSSENDTNEFLGWLGRVSLGSPQKFLRALERAPDARTHLVVGHTELREYDFATLDGCRSGSDEIVSLERIRKMVRAKGTELSAWAEQWLDLLERTGMTHAFVLQRAPPVIFLLNLPAATSSVVAERRIAVLRHLSDELGMLWPGSEVTDARGDGNGQTATGDPGH
jgi:hypothetical protein